MVKENYNPKKEIEKISKEHKIYLSDPSEAEALEIAGFLPLIHKELLTFLEQEKKNGFYILYVTDPNHKEHKYPCKIKYEGNEEVREVLPNKEMELRGIVNLLFAEKKNNEALHYVTEFLTKKYSFKSILGSNGDEIFVYEDGIYKKKGKEIIRKELERLLKEKYSSYRVREITHQIATITSIEREELVRTDENLICLKNGILDLKTSKLMPHSKDIIFLTKIPVNYNPSAKCPKILKFFEEVFYKEDIKPYIEWVGFQLYRRYLLKTAVIHVGGTDTAKTRVILLMKIFIGEENTTGKSLQELTGDKFALAELYKKHANIHDDMSSQDITDTGKFKQITGSSPLNCRFIYSSPFNFMNWAKLTFACNKIPQTKEVDDDAYYNKWMIFRHDNIFDKKDPSTDPKIIDKITTDEELSGLLNIAIKGLKEILDKGHFSYDKNWEEIKEIMHKRGSPISSFAKNQLHEQDEMWISKQDLFEAHVKYCKEQKLPQTTKDNFSKNITKYCLFMRDGKKEKVRGWYNIRVGGWQGNYTKIK